MLTLTVSIPWHSPIYSTSYRAGKNKHVFVCMHLSGLRFGLVGGSSRDSSCAQLDSMQKNIS